MTTDKAAGLSSSNENERRVTAQITHNQHCSPTSTLVQQESSSRIIHAPLARRSTSLKASGIPGSNREFLLITKDIIHAVLALHEFTQRIHGDISPETMHWYRHESKVVGVLQDLDIPPAPGDEKTKKLPSPNSRASDFHDLLAKMEQSAIDRKLWREDT